MPSLTIATRNSNKTREIQEILGPQFSIRDLSEMKRIPEIAETGTTFEENAVLKAVGVSQHLPGLILADDSGLEVDALDGAPGVFSARYAGARADDRDNVKKLLGELAKADPEHQRRQARFRCVLALAQNGELLQTFIESVEGKIVTEPRGAGGFGYDPVFVPNGYDKTFAELPPSVKNRRSHRARALEKAKPFLEAALRK